MTANATPDSNTADNTGSVQVAIEPGSLFSDVAAGDPDWQNQIDGVDVMFQKSGTSTYTLKATNPGTFKYRLSLENETGIDIHVKGKQLPNVVRRGYSIKDANGGSTTIFLTVPSMPANTGTPTVRREPHGARVPAHGLEARAGTPGRPVRRDKHPGPSTSRSPPGPSPTVRGRRPGPVPTAAVQL